MTVRERILAVLSGAQPIRLPFMPITMMFAAQHIGAKYRAYACDHRVLAEAQIRTADTFGFIYVSVISVPVLEAADLGAAVEQFEDQPPASIETRALLAEQRRLIGLRPPDLTSAPRMLVLINSVPLLRERAGRDQIVE